MRNIFLFAIIFSIALSFALPAPAQEKPAQFVEVVTVHVKSEAVEQFEDCVKKFVEAWDKIGGTQYWGVANFMFGGEGYDYMLSFPFDTWSAVDQWTVPQEGLIEAFGEDEAKRIGKAWDNSVEGMESRVYRLLDDMITHADKQRTTPAKYYTITFTEVIPTMNSTYRLSIKKYMEAEEKTPGSKMAIRRVSAFGPAGVYITTRAWDKLGEADDMPSVNMEEIFGEAEARQINEAISSSIKERHTVLLEFRPDLSRIPKAGATDN